MFDLNLNIFPVTVKGRTPPDLVTRLRERLWAWQHGHEFVRYSISAMVRIQVDDRYLLVRNRHFGKYQPIGGVLKRLSHSKLKLSELGVREDNMFAVDDTNRGDLRLQVPAGSLAAFSDWYASRLGREFGPWREFYEELLAPGILDNQLFPYAQLQYLRQHSTGITRARHINDGARFECRIAEIFELEPTRVQADALRELLSRRDVRVMWATAEEIKTRGVVAKRQPEAVIAETAEWIL